MKGQTNLIKVPVKVAPKSIRSSYREFLNTQHDFETWVVVVLRSPIHANEPSEYNGMLYRTSNRVLNNGMKVIILICMDGTSQYHHHRNLRLFVVMVKGSFEVMHWVYIQHRKTQILSLSGSVHGQNDSKICKK